MSLEAPTANQTARDTVRAIEAAMPKLKRYAWALCRQSDVADDLVQDTMERALRNLHAFEHGTNVEAWLYTILRNAFRSRVKRSWSDCYEPETLETFLEPTLPAQLQGLELEDLERAIDALPEDMREAVLLVGLEGLSYNDAAETLGINTGTLKSRVSRSRDLLRKLFEGHAEREGAAAPERARLQPRAAHAPQQTGAGGGLLRLALADRRAAGRLLAS
ncbi:MAG TPA: sigma-70 family RNA polymerase sigma factor [Alphaproteobacteria bacterium]|nr:sigma-70 family RNA polymerase sigma factor [Alphaproteobacteria bacterium]